MGFFEADLVLVADQPAQKIGREGAAGKELGVRPAVGRARKGEPRIVDHLGRVVGVEAAVGTQELDVQVAGDRQVEHGVNRVFALLLGDLADRFADVLLQLGLVVGALDDQGRDGAANAGLNDLEFAVGLFGFALDRLAQGRVLHLGQLFLLGAGRQLAPGRAGIVQVPVLQGEGKAGPVGSGLAENRQTLLPATLQPVQAAAVDLGVFAGRHNDVVQDRALGDPRPVFPET